MINIFITTFGDIMSNYSDAFRRAFDHAMLYEVGKFWNASDPDVIAGTIGTRELNRKVGYVNIPSDRGGETKYGIAQKPNPDVNVKQLDLQSAEDIYYDRYWLRGDCDKLPHQIAVIHFDSCVNHGVVRAKKMLQQAVNAQPDGQIGPKTLQAITSTDPVEVIQSICDIRTNFYKSIVVRDPSQKIFLNGWMNRINEVTSYSLSL